MISMVNTIMPIILMNFTWDWGVHFFLFFFLFYFISISFLFYVCYLLIIKNTHKSTIRSWHIDLQTFTLKMLHIKMLGVCPLYNLVFRIC